jgi:hypothetical protein
VSHEVSVLILDLLEHLITDMQQELSVIDPPSPLMDKIFNLFLLFMQKRQSEQFLHLLYASLRSFVVKFPQHFFKINTSYCGNLSYELFRHCSSSNEEVRIEAATLFYLLLKVSFYIQILFKLKLIKYLNDSFYLMFFFF